MRNPNLKKAGAFAATAACALATTVTVSAPAHSAPVEETGFVVVQSGTGSAKAVDAITAAGGTVVQEWPQIGVVFASATDDTFDDTVRTKPGIKAAGPTRNLVAYVDSVPTTPVLTPPQLGPGTRGGDDTAEPLNANQWDMRQIKADKAHLKTDGNRNVTVGVLDSGIDLDHPDLATNIDTSQSVSCVNKGVPSTEPKDYQNTTSDHGTHVAGTIAAARNGVGIVGVAPNVKLASVKVVDDDGFIYPEYAVCGFIWAAEKGMEVTNNSYFVDPYYLWCRANVDEEAAVLAVERSLRYSEKKDVVNIAAAGNSFWDLSKPITDTGSPNNQEGSEVEREYDENCDKLPGSLGNTMMVSSVGPKKNLSYFSNYGLGKISVTAPGGDRLTTADTPDTNGRVLSTVANGVWGYKQGTSMASPHAAGVMALIRGSDPKLRARQAIKTLERDADVMPCPEIYDNNGDGKADAECEGGASGAGFFGHGMVDALDAVTKGRGR